MLANLRREKETCGERVRNCGERELAKPAQRELETCRERVRDLWRERES